MLLGKKKCKLKNIIKTKGNKGQIIVWINTPEQMLDFVTDLKLRCLIKT